MPIVATEERQQLMSEGFCVFKDVLDPQTVANLNAMSEWTIAQEEPDHFEKHRAQGCILPYWKYSHPAFADLLIHPGALSALAELGFSNPKVWSGYVISKPPHSPPLYWHQDGVLWNHPISYTNKPQQYFLMYYLVDTDLDNGCLRVIPGSHLKRHALHDLGREAHQADEITRATNLDHPALRKAAGEIDVPVAAGDVVIGDSRLLHSAHANQSDQRRTVLTIWYWPDYDNLPEEVKGLITSSMDQNEEWCRWIEQTQSVTGSLVPVHEEGMEVVKRNNVAGESLR